MYLGINRSLRGRDFRRRSPTARICSGKEFNSTGENLLSAYGNVAFVPLCILRRNLLPREWMSFRNVRKRRKRIHFIPDGASAAEAIKRGSGRHANELQIYCPVHQGRPTPGDWTRPGSAGDR
ncbi:hypothetical protein NPIL_564361 [Nephila pilipes]|uniref:Uncharacterized protein n=1 Tax=Nephila pilipes TaxID=299642 RepID=A0A8X6PSC0_NEPPI|nr:hypothetical protein NPIL_564361 [Nephila pilipes]